MTGLFSVIIALINAVITLLDSVVNLLGTQLNGGGGLLEALGSLMANTTLLVDALAYDMMGNVTALMYAMNSFFGLIYGILAS